MKRTYPESWNISILEEDGNAKKTDLGYAICLAFGIAASRRMYAHFGHAWYV